jgi:hypothetical protein
LSEIACASSRHHHYEEIRIDSRIDQVKVQVQDEQLEEVICLKLGVYIVIMDMKIWLTHSGVWGSNLQDFTKQAQSRKVFHLELDKSLIIKLKWNAQGKGLLLIGFLFYRSHMLVGRLGYRIVAVLS